MIQKAKFETLHAHTIESDGQLTHEEVLNVCNSTQIRLVAFTDHDALISLEKFERLSKLNHPTDFISGIEISSGLPKEMGGGTTSMLHIVGLFVNPTNRALMEHCKKAQSARIQRMQKMVKNLNSLGFTITQEDCLEASGGEAIGRPHIVQALTQKESNMKIIRAIAKKMLKDAQKNPELRTKYDRMLAEKDEKRYPYTLFLTPESYLKGVYVDYSYWTDFDTSVKLIREAEGVAILAHWITIAHILNKEFIDKAFSEDRLDGAETVFGLWTKFKGTWDSTEEYISDINKLVKKHNKLASGGADAHVLKDFEEFSANPWYAKRTIGLAQKMLKNSNVNRRWSSIK